MENSTTFRRRAALGLFASLPALAILPAVAIASGIEPDPIFAAIDRHKEANRIWNEIDDDLDETADAAAAVIEGDALADFLSTAPLTVAGIRAGIEYAIEASEGEYAIVFAETLLHSLLPGGDGQHRGLDYEEDIAYRADAIA